MLYSCTNSLGLVAFNIQPQLLFAYEGELNNNNNNNTTSITSLPIWFLLSFLNFLWAAVWVFVNLTIYLITFVHPYHCVWVWMYFCACVCVCVINILQYKFTSLLLTHTHTQIVIIMITPCDYYYYYLPTTTSTSPFIHRLFPSSSSSS